MKTFIAFVIFVLVSTATNGLAQEATESNQSQAIANAVPTADSKTIDTVTDQWSQWRGPNRDGSVSQQNQWPDSLNESVFKKTWSEQLQPSYSGPITSARLVFTTETQNQSEEVVRAFDRKTGEQKWESRWTGAMTVPFFAKANGDWIRSTPAFDGERLYVAGMRDVLVCLDAADGSKIWQVDFVEKFGTPLPNFGFVCSPLLIGDFVYVQAGGGFCKIKKSTGNVVWRTLVDAGGMNGSAFSSPIEVDLGGKRQILVQTRRHLAGVDPETGNELWTKEIPAFRGMNILTPTKFGESVFTSAYGGKSFMFKISTNSDQLVAQESWINRATAYMSSPVVIDNHVYMHLRNQRFTCIDLRTGESKWTTKPFGKYWSMVFQGDKILALDESGKLRLIKASPNEYVEIDSRKISDQETWAHLAVSGSQVFIRELQGMSAFEWKAE